MAYIYRSDRRRVAVHVADDDTEASGADGRPWSPCRSDAAGPLRVSGSSARASRRAGDCRQLAERGLLDPRAWRSCEAGLEHEGVAHALLAAFVDLTAQLSWAPLSVLNARMLPRLTLGLAIAS